MSRKPGVPHAASQARRALASKIHDVVALEIEAIGRIVRCVDPADQRQAERGARTIACTSRTLRDINLMIDRDDDAVPGDAVDARIPRNIDELRRELARCMRGLAKRAR
jgi:hypothetical protein